MIRPHRNRNRNRNRIGSFHRACLWQFVSQAPLLEIDGLGSTDLTAFGGGIE